ncbi:MAG: MarR family winged helix-turn-helix transcriptional regulator [Ilumatobacter sp.]|uniref:MarR family winged helix-turn-helix transcriptional regulator n=1 Tax=Ilumatobacter sp. TaxID=1967498 RepID=UPI003918AC28
MNDVRWLDDTQQQAWRALLAFVNRGLPRIDRTLKAHGLLGVHYSILVGLSAAPGDTMRLTDLADAANLSPSRLTHRLKTMIESGHVEISDDEIDRRSKHATLTADGRAFLERLAPIHVEDVRRLVFDHLDPDETIAFANAMSKIASPLCDHDFAPPAR